MHSHLYTSKVVSCLKHNSNHLTILFRVCWLWIPYPSLLCFRVPPVTLDSFSYEDSILFYSIRLAYGTSAIQETAYAWNNAWMCIWDFLYKEKLETVNKTPYVKVGQQNKQTNYVVKDRKTMSQILCIIFLIKYCFQFLSRYTSSKSK